MPNIFKEQVARKPDLYPWTNDFINAMWAGHWTPNEFNFRSDVQNFKADLSDEERKVVVKTLSAIGQIEIAVKKFWAKLGDTLPHPSMVDMGLVMAQIEVIHNKAYEKLLDVLGINEAFEENLKLDIISGRVKYLRKYLDKNYDDEKKQFVYALILFTLFVENVSLFSQFYIISWFNRYKNVLKDTAQQVQYTAKEETCFIEGTEVLTPNGWKDFRNIKIGDLVTQYNEDGSLEFTEVLKTIVNEFEGDLIKFSNVRNLCLVTPNHDMVYYNKNNIFMRKKASDLKIHKQLHIPIGGILNNDGENILSFEDRLKIAIQADGCKLIWTNINGDKLPRGINGGKTHVITITKKRKQDRLDWILNNLNFEYEKSNPNEDGEISYSIAYNQELDYKSLQWVDIKNKTSIWCKEFINECIEWDGYKEYNHVGYCSVNKSNIDIVQNIAIMAGFVTNIYEGNESERKDSYKNCYKLSIMDTNLKPKSHSLKKEYVPYSGNVYCITVSSGNIITRYKNKTFIAGNCHAQIGIKLVQVIRQEFPKLFDEELAHKIEHEAKEAFKAESKIIDWILDGYTGDRINADVLKEYIKSRINDSLEQIGFKKIYEINENLARDFEWMDEEVLGNTSTDFFYKRPVEYSKKNKTFNAEDMF